MAEQPTVKEPLSGIYISSDIESSGPSGYSMLSLGMCVMGRPDITFYRELKPLDFRYNIEALKVGALHLECLPRISTYDATSPDFDPDATMDALMDLADEPSRVMCDARDWIETVNGSHSPILLTDVQPFDGSFIFSYFNTYTGACPFGHKGRNIDEVYRGIRRDAHANLRDLNIADDRKRPHHALDDAIFQAKLGEPIHDIIDPQWRERLTHLK